MSENESYLESLLRGAVGGQYIPAPGEAAMGIALVGALCQRLMNESAMYELRCENERLRNEALHARDNQIAALAMQNAQLLALLQEQVRAGSPQAAQAAQVLELARRGQR